MHIHLTIIPSMPRVSDQAVLLIICRRDTSFCRQETLWEAQASSESVATESFLSSDWPSSGSDWTAVPSLPLGLIGDRESSQKNNTKKRVMGLGALGWRGKNDEGPVKGQEINFFLLTDL